MSLSLLYSLPFMETEQALDAACNASSCLWYIGARMACR